MIKNNKTKAIFLDKDGTLSEELGYNCSFDKFKLIDGSLEALKLFKKLNYLSFIITNQSGIARAYFREQDFKEFSDNILSSLNDKEELIKKLYYCPHHASMGFGEYKLDCDCRKPKIGLLEKARFDFNIDLENSYVIGDKASDIMLGKNASCKTILVLTGYGKEDKVKLEAAGIVPDYIADDLLGAAMWIKKV
ncbi:MAG: D-glycero-beta-D-manno-heptose 1,7-bisphosphate 7-phosphatase [Pseudomonadota bacterium]